MQSSSNKIKINKPHQIYTTSYNNLNKHSSTPSNNKTMHYSRIMSLTTKYYKKQYKSWPLNYNDHILISFSLTYHPPYLLISHLLYAVVYLRKQFVASAYYLIHPYYTILLLLLYVVL